MRTGRRSGVSVGLIGGLVLLFGWVLYAVVIDLVLRLVPSYARRRRAHALRWPAQAIGGTMAALGRLSQHPRKTRPVARASAVARVTASPRPPQRA
jgi:hypothetical protein